MRLIDADTPITAQIYDDEHEEFVEKRMTIADYIDAYTDEGCPPTIELKQGKWERLSAKLLQCSVCGRVTDEPTTFAFCPSCGAKMERSENND